MLCIKKVLETAANRGVSWKQMAGVAMLTGIGFAMSIFIANLAAADAEVRSYAKVAVLLASVVAATAGLLVFFGIKKTAEAETTERV